MAMREPSGSELVERAMQLRRMMQDAACGPLAAAAVVVGLAENWEAYKEEAGGRKCTTWLRDELGRGRGLSFFKQRHDAVRRAGEHTRRTWHHEALLWAVNSCHDELTLKRLDRAVLDAKKVSNGGNPLTKQQVMRIAVPIIGRTPKKQVECARCERLSKALMAAGLPVPE
jgi:hypothetical protein